MFYLGNITTELLSAENHFYILRNVSLGLSKGEILGLAGESGSGKSVLAKTVIGLNNAPVVMTGGTVSVCGNELKTKKNFASIRGKIVSMIFQNPTSSLNPVMTIGAQLTETLQLHNNALTNDKARIEAAELLESVEIDRPAERLGAYPHQLSGGMNQRVMIALALASKPEILIADEPTTALDVTIQAQIIKLLMKLNSERGLSTLFISHDLSLLSSICGRIAVLYCGELMEITTGDNLKSGMLHHPYTMALKDCIPKINMTGKLNTIKGSIGRNDFSKSFCCIFADRCSYAQNLCFATKPEFNGKFACHYPLK